MSVKIDASNFNRAMQELSRLSGVSFKQVIVSETGAVLKATIKNQIAADSSKIRARQAKGKISKQEMQELLKRRGLAKQSWLAMGNKLGLSVEAPAYVKKAQVKGKLYDQKVKVTEKKVGGLFTLVLENSMQAAIASMGRYAIIKAINRRSAYFRRNLKVGVFNKVATIARKYPGLRVRGF